MPRPYRRFTPGRGRTPQTIITALQDVDLTDIDGRTVLKAGQQQVYDFDLAASLRSYTQRRTLSRLLGSQAISLQQGLLQAEEQPVEPEQPVTVETPAVADQPVEPEQPADADPLLSMPLVEEQPVSPEPQEAGGLSREDRMTLLLELPDVGQRMAERLLELQNPTVEQLLAVPRFPKDRQLAEQAWQILTA